MLELLEKLERDHELILEQLNEAKQLGISHRQAQNLFFQL